MCWSCVFSSTLKRPSTRAAAHRRFSVFPGADAGRVARFGPKAGVTPLVACVNALAARAVIQRINITLGPVLSPGASFIGHEAGVL